MYLGSVFVGVKNGRPLGKRPIQDALSRCRRIERCLGVDLDRSINASLSGVDSLLEMIDRNVDSFEIDGTVSTGISSIKNAAKRYHDFRLWECNAG
jgi:hypothetical protein